MNMWHSPRPVLTWLAYFRCRKLHLLLKLQNICWKDPLEYINCSVSFPLAITFEDLILLCLLKSSLVMLISLKIPSFLFSSCSRVSSFFLFLRNLPLWLVPSVSAEVLFSLSFLFCFWGWLHSFLLFSLIIFENNMQGIMKLPFLLFKIVSSMFLFTCLVHTETLS